MALIVSVTIVKSRTDGEPDNNHAPESERLMSPERETNELDF